MKKISINLKILSNNELLELLNKGNNLEGTIQEVTRRKNIELFIRALANRNVFNNQKLFKTLAIKAISLFNANKENLFDILQAVMLHPDIKNTDIGSLKMLMKADHTNMAFSLLNANTPDDVVDDIIMGESLMKATYLNNGHLLVNNPILKSTINLLKKGFAWGNQKSLQMLVPRNWTLNQKGTVTKYKKDPFMEEIAKYNFSLTNLELLHKAADQSMWTKFTENLEANNTINNKLIRFVRKKTQFHADFIMEVEDVLKNKEVKQESKTQIIKHLKNFMGFEDFKSLTNTWGEKFFEKAKELPFLAELTVKVCEQQPEYIIRYYLPEMEDLIHYLYSLPNARTILNRIPKKIIEKIALIDQQREFLNVNQNSNEEYNIYEEEIDDFDINDLSLDETENN